MSNVYERWVGKKSSVFHVWMDVESTPFAVSDVLNELPQSCDGLPFRPRMPGWVKHTLLYCLVHTPYFLSSSVNYPRTSLPRTSVLDPPRHGRCGSGIRPLRTYALPYAHAHAYTSALLRGRFIALFLWDRGDRQTFLPRLPSFQPSQLFLK